MSPPAETLEERVARIEALIGQVILKAQDHPLGRKILAILGLA